MHTESLCWIGHRMVEWNFHYMYIASSLHWQVQAPQMCWEVQISSVLRHYLSKSVVKPTCLLLSPCPPCHIWPVLCTGKFRLCSQMCWEVYICSALAPISLGACGDALVYVLLVVCHTPNTWGEKSTLRTQSAIGLVTGLVTGSLIFP